MEDVPNIDFIAAAIACNGDEKRHAYCQQLVAEACPEVETIMSVPNWFDVLPRGVNKASALDTILDAVGATRDEVVVFGDSGNDVADPERGPLLRRCGKRDGRGQGNLQL